jgi:hypothetical protein
VRQFGFDGAANLFAVWHIAHQSGVRWAASNDASAGRGTRLTAAGLPCNDPGGMAPIIEMSSAM